MVGKRLSFEGSDLPLEDILPLFVSLVWVSFFRQYLVRDLVYKCAHEVSCQCFQNSSLFKRKLVSSINQTHYCYLLEEEAATKDSHIERNKFNFNECDHLLS